MYNKDQVMHGLKEWQMSNTIFVEIEGKEIDAFVTEIVNRHQNLYKLSFSNGYENIFYADVETGNWIEEDLGFTDLARQVGNKVRSFMRTPFHVPKILTWHQQYINNNLICFGFFNFMNGEQKFYQIYDANRKYMYTLVDMDNDEWQILGNSLSLHKQIDTRFAHRIIQILSSYTANAE